MARLVKSKIDVSKYKRVALSSIVFRTREDLLTFDRQAYAAIVSSTGGGAA